MVDAVNNDKQNPRSRTTSRAQHDVTHTAGHAAGHAAGYDTIVILKLYRSQRTGLPTKKAALKERRRTHFFVRL